MEIHLEFRDYTLVACENHIHFHEKSPVLSLNLFCFSMLHCIIFRIRANALKKTIVGSRLQYTPVFNDKNFVRILDSR